MRKHKLAKLLALTLCTGLIITSSVNLPLKKATADTTTAADSSSTQAPPDKPDGAPPSGDGSQNGQTPPDKPDGQPGGGNEASSVTLSGANTADGKAVTYDGSKDSSTLSSTKSDENTVLATNGGTYTLTNAALKKSGDTSNNDSSNFYGVNAILAATKNSSAYITDSTLASDSEGSNALFATGSAAKIYAKNVTIKTTGNSSRGLDATYEGTVIASDLSVTTSGDHCGALATDRGGGNISVDNATLNTSGQGSPLIYSTGVIEVNNVSGESTGSQIVGMEGLNTVRIKNSTLTGSAKKASEPVANGVILYQSTSGDSSNGTANFEASDSTLKSHISGGAMFYVTNTDASIVLSNTKLDFDSDKNTLLTVGGNDGSNNWGTKGSNGGDVTFTAIKETLSGDISCDGISNVTFYLTNGSTYTGTIINDTTYTGNGGVSMNLAKGTIWTITKDTTLSSLNIADGASILDENGKTVTVKTTDGKTVVEGTGDITITAGSYSTTDTSSKAGSISDFAVDRTTFNTWASTGTDNSKDNTSSDDSNKNDSNKDNASTSNSVKKPSTTTITSAKAKKTSATIKWKKVSKCSGYIVYRSTKKSSAYKKIATVTKTVYKDTPLKSGKKYYYKVQAYLKTDDATTYGSKSKAKAVKTK